MIKKYFALILSLALLPLFALELNALTQSKGSRWGLLAQAISVELENHLQVSSFNIKVGSNDDFGYGVILGKNNNEYLVLTYSQVVSNQELLKITTNDGQTHEGSFVEERSASGLQLIKFTSANSYEPVELNPAAQTAIGHNIVTIGYDIAGNLITNLTQVSQEVRAGQFNYSHNSHTNDDRLTKRIQAIFNNNGELIGFNNQEVNSFNTINNFLQQINPQITAAYNLKTPTSNKIATSDLTGKLKELEQTAKKITVNIKSSSGEWGSGVIVRRDGKTYTVLTVKHVLCEPESTDTEECADNIYEIVTHDGKTHQTHQLMADTIKLAEEADLATVQFSSQENYQPAILADYAPIDRNSTNYTIAKDDTNNDVDSSFDKNDLTRSKSDNSFVSGVAGDRLPPNVNSISSQKAHSLPPTPLIDRENSRHFVFAAGYPKYDRDSQPEWLFSPGYALDRKLGSYNIYDRTSLDEGYELVYTCITYGGMSGGAILDLEGRVIGIHGKAEGDGNTRISLGYSLAIPVGILTNDKNNFGEISLAGERDELNLNDITIETSLPPSESQFNQQVEELILTTETPQNNASSCESVYRGNQLWRLGQYENAKIAFQKAIDTSKTQCIHLAWYGKGLSLTDQALEESLLVDLREENWRTKYLKAAEAFDRAASLDRNFVASLRRESRTWRILGDYEQALEAIDRAIQLESDNPSLYNDRGALLVNLRRYQDAISDYEQAINLQSDFYLPYYNRGLIYAHQAVSGEEKKWSLAEKDFRQAIKFKANYGPAYYNLGNLYYFEEKWKKAEENYNQAIKYEQYYTQAYHNLGYIKDNQYQDYDSALGLYSKAIHYSNSQYIPAYLNRAKVYAIQKRWQEALQDYDRAIKLKQSNNSSDGDADAFFYRGLVYFKLERRTKAILDLKEAQTLYRREKNDAGYEKATNYLQQIQINQNL